MEVLRAVLEVLAAQEVVTVAAVARADEAVGAAEEVQAVRVVAEVAV